MESTFLVFLASVIGAIWENINFWGALDQIYDTLEGKQVENMSFIGAIWGKIHFLGILG